MRHNDFLFRSRDRGCGADQSRHQPGTQYGRAKFIEGTQKDFNNLYKTSYASTESVVISDECPEDSLLQHIYKRRKATNDNELDQYLAAPVSLYGTDILNWWKVNVLYIIKPIILYYIYLYINFIYLFIYRVMKFNILV